MTVREKSSATQYNPPLVISTSTCNSPIKSTKRLFDAKPESNYMHDECSHSDDTISIDSSICSEPCSNCYCCDACPYCDDVCDIPACESCMNKSQHNEIRNDRFNVLCPENSTKYTKCQVSRHNTSSSAWLVSGKFIYDATDYIKFHPGGAESILRRAGGTQDCFEDMEFHSKGASRILKKLKIGLLRPCPGSLVVSSVMKPEENQCVIC